MVPSSMPRVNYAPVTINSRQRSKCKEIHLLAMVGLAQKFVRLSDRYRSIRNTGINPSLHQKREK